MAAAETAVSMQGITKRFPGVVANDRVDFEAAVGEVHALLGENGAGKTTLSHVLTGLYRADEGRISLYGEPVQFESPREAIDAGVCMVHQQFRLVERFTVAENLVLGDRQRGRPQLPHRPERGREPGARAGRALPPARRPDARIWQLSVGEQQRVEILNALYQNAKVLILDEPTAVLTPDEADTLFETLRQMAARGADGHLHLAQAPRGDGGLGPRHGPARRAPRGRRCAPPTPRRSRSPRSWSAATSSPGAARRARRPPAATC